MKKHIVTIGCVISAAFLYAGIAFAGGTIVAEYNPDKLVLDKDVDGEAHVRQMLWDALMEKLLDMGYKRDTIPKVINKAKVLRLNASGREVRVTVAGKSERKMLYRPQAKIALTFSDHDLALLYGDLRDTPLETLEHCHKLYERIGLLKQYGGSKDNVARLDNYLSPHWGNMLNKGVAARMQGVSPASPDYINTLKEIWLAMRELVAAYPQDSTTKDVLASFEYFVMNYVNSFKGGAEDIKPFLDGFAELEGITEAQAAPILVKAKQKLSSIWGSHLQSLFADDDTGASNLHEEYAKYAAVFAGTPKLAEIKAEFKTAYFKRLKSMRPVSVNELSAYTAQFANFKNLFPDTKESEEIAEDAGKFCGSVLKSVNIENSEELSLFGDSWSVCRSLIKEDAVLGEIMGKYQEGQAEQLKRQEEKELKGSLGERDFIMQWDRAIRQAVWGKDKNSFYVKKELRELWGMGEQIDRCACALVEDELCRRYESAGGTQYEVAARFYENKLYEIEICGIYVGDGGRAIMQYMEKSYSLVSKKSEAQDFLTGKGGIETFTKGVRYGDKARGTEIAVKKPGVFVQVSYVSKAELARKEKREAQLAREAEAAAERARRERIKRGYKEGDCVMWDCSPYCQFYGTVRQVRGGKLRVAIERSEDRPEQVGSAVWLEPSEVLDCD